MSKIDSKGHKWWYRLVKSSEHPGTKSLFEDIPVSDLYNKLVICLINEKGFRYYSVFTDYLDFGKFYLDLPSELKNYYEVILAEYAQKPHFDLDFKDVPLEFTNKVFDLLIQELIAGFKDLYQVNLDPSKDILIYTSHGDNKRSYHIVIDNYCHSNNKEAKYLYSHVIEKILIIGKSMGFEKLYNLENIDYTQFVDSAVYNSRQQFRIMGSSKAGIQRPKILNESWEYSGIKVKYEFKDSIPEKAVKLYHLQNSLVSDTNNCVFLKDLYVEPSRKIASIDFDVDLDRASDLLKNYDDSYEIIEQKGSLVVLKRLYPSVCRLCDRVHEHENPFLTLRQRGGKIEVYFYCRRSEDKSLFLGMVNDSLDSEIAQLVNGTQSSSLNQSSSLSSSSTLNGTQSSSLNSSSILHGNSDKEKLNNSGSFYLPEHIPPSEITGPIYEYLIDIDSNNKPIVKQVKPDIKDAIKDMSNEFLGGTREVVLTFPAGLKVKNIRYVSDNKVDNPNVNTSTVSPPRKAPQKRKPSVNKPGGMDLFKSELNQEK